jgi:hypothetical protein
MTDSTMRTVRNHPWARAYHDTPLAKADWCTVTEGTPGRTERPARCCSGTAGA